MQKEQLINLLSLVFTIMANPKSLEKMISSLSIKDEQFNPGLDFGEIEKVVLQSFEQEFAKKSNMTPVVIQSKGKRIVRMVPCMDISEVSEEAYD